MIQDRNTYVEAQIETQPPESPGLWLFVPDKDKSNKYVGNLYLPIRTGRYAAVCGSIKSLPKNVQSQYLTRNISWNIHSRTHWSTFHDWEIGVLETSGRTAGRSFIIKTLNFQFYHQVRKEYALLHHWSVRVGLQTHPSPGTALKYWPGGMRGQFSLTVLSSPAEIQSRPLTAYLNEVNQSATTPVKMRPAAYPSLHLM